ncbi:MAG: hypothetical protein F6J87_08360 [Spirulina sp. SIO3F2]|nr:hypothetical protein [Spirulina sp. SIO3F2]
MHASALIPCLTMGWLAVSFASLAIALPVQEQPVKLQPRIGASFQSGTEQGDGSAFGSIYGFVPFEQVPGMSTIYTEGKLNLMMWQRITLASMILMVRRPASPVLAIRGVKQPDFLGGVEL